tara:strand:- start:167351 stop:168148 length:798 start_codon:yes stop_codon:yes gene_type:complete
MRAHVLVPLKDLVLAKSRLSGLLAPHERRALAQAMAEDVLAALSSTAAVEGITLVSDDPGAQLLAQRYAAHRVSEQSLGCRGLNAVLERACDELQQRLAQSLPQTDAPVFIVMHADLPLLQPADIASVLERQRLRGGVLVVSDDVGTGTNLLAFDESARPRFCFGADSCARHLAAAQKAGIHGTTMHRDNLALDVDCPRDLAELLRRLETAQDASARHTRALLLGTPLGQRLQLVLAELSHFSSDTGPALSDITVDDSTMKGAGR